MGIHDFHEPERELGNSAILLLESLKSKSLKSAISYGHPSLSLSLASWVLLLTPFLVLPLSFCCKKSPFCFTQSQRQRKRENHRLYTNA